MIKNATRVTPNKTPYSAIPVMYSVSGGIAALPLTDEMSSLGFSMRGESCVNVVDVDFSGTSRVFAIIGTVSMRFGLILVKHKCELRSFCIKVNTFSKYRARSKTPCKAPCDFCVVHSRRCQEIERGGSGLERGKDGRDTGVLPSLAPLCHDFTPSGKVHARLQCSLKFDLPRVMYGFRSRKSFSLALLMLQRAGLPFSANQASLMTDSN